MCIVQGTCSIKLVLHHAKETVDLWYGGLGQQTFQNIFYIHVVGEQTKFELTYNNSINEWHLTLLINLTETFFLVSYKVPDVAMAIQPFSKRPKVASTNSKLSCTFSQ